MENPPKGSVLTKRRGAEDLRGVVFRREVDVLVTLEEEGVSGKEPHPQEEEEEQDSSPHLSLSRRGPGRSRVTAWGSGGSRGVSTWIMCPTNTQGGIQIYL